MRAAARAAWAAYAAGALLLAAAAFVVHLAANPHYGFFRDELYFIACGFHPDFGYVDQHSLLLLRASTAPRRRCRRTGPTCTAGPS